MHSGRALRLHRLLDPRTERGIVVAFDHGLFLGPAPGVEDVVAAMRRVAEGGPDALQVSPGVAAAAGAIFHGRGAPALVLRLDASNTWRSTSPPRAPYRVPVATPADAVRLVITSLKEPTETFQPTFVPFVQFTPTLNNWIDQFRLAGRDIARDLRNSLTTALASAALALVLGSLAGYSLARFTFRVGPVRNHDIATWFLSQVIIPPVVVVIPFFLFMQRLGITDTPLALILAHTTINLPLATLLMRDTFLALPVELEEAAMVDGASRLVTLGRVVLPLAAPALK